MKVKKQELEREAGVCWRIEKQFLDLHFFFNNPQKKIKKYYLFMLSQGMRKEASLCFYEVIKKIYFDFICSKFTKKLRL